MKINKSNILVIVVVSIIVIYLSLKDNFFSIIKAITHINVGWVLVSIIAVVIYWALEAKTLHLMIKEFKQDFRYRDTFHTVIDTQFFNCITPFSSGGQPFQIYMLTKFGLKVSTATSAALQNFIIYQIVLVLYGLFAILMQYTFDILVIDLALLKTIALMGFTLNAAVIIGLLAISSSPRFNKFVTHSVLNFLHKIHLIKNIEEKRNKFTAVIHDFHDNAVILRKNIDVFSKGILYNVLKLTVLYSIPFILALSLSIKSISFFDALIGCAFVMLVSAFVPLPGGSGGVELTFIVLFSSFIIGPEANALMLIWRFITHYFGMFVGFAVFTFGQKPIKGV